jgi:hypothetical protein
MRLCALAICLTQVEGWLVTAAANPSAACWLGIHSLLSHKLRCRVSGHLARCAPVAQGGLSMAGRDLLFGIASCLWGVATWGCGALPLGQAERRALEGVVALMHNTALRYKPGEAGQGQVRRRLLTGWERAGLNLAAPLRRALTQQQQQQGPGAGAGAAEGPRAGPAGAEAGEGAAAGLQARLERSRALGAGSGCSYVGCVSLLGPSECDLRCRRCSGCGVVRYCSPECQRADWVQHHGRVCAQLASNMAGAGLPAL